ncbi:MAG: cupin domain-containing protein [Actinobacteria bacterium]|nr:cupin domain-containing protein [Actinomycetota bacterium]
MSAPTNAFRAECDGEGWPEGVRGARLLERPPGTKLVSAVWELDPGAESPQYHLHHATEELLLVVAGTATLKTPEGERMLEPGEVVHFPLGAPGAHKVLNRSDAPVRYLMIAAHSRLDVIEYLDTNEVVVYSHEPSILAEDPIFFRHELEPRKE